MKCSLSQKRLFLLKYHVLIILFLFVFFVFNANLRSTPAGDSIPTSLLPFSIILDKSITLDRFHNWYNEYFPLKPLYFFIVTKGHVYSIYPPTLSLIITPLYVPPILFLGVMDWPVQKIVILAGVMEKIVASLITSFSVVLLFYLLRKFVNRKEAIFLSIIYALGTSTWSISSQALWQHGPSQLMIIITLLYLKSSFEEQKISSIVLAGVFAGLSVAVRPTNFLFLLSSFICIFISIFLGKWKIRSILFYSFPILVIVTALAAYNHSIFGDIRGIHASHAFDTDFFVGLTGLLLSPGRGLFFYSPFFIFTFFGIYVWFKENRGFCPPLYIISLLFVIFHILLISKYFAWWGGWIYGPRYLTDTIPCLMILLIPSLPYVSRFYIIKLVFILLVLLSIEIQIIGTFFYPRGQWDELPVSVSEKPSRLWDWRDNPVLRNALAGPELGPHLRLLGLSKPLSEGDFRVSYDQIKGPDRMVTGSTEIFEVTLTNRSEKMWFTSGFNGVNSIHLSYHWYDQEKKKVIWDGHRSKLPTIFRPMTPTKTKLHVTSPSDPGKYTLAVDLVQEGFAWFSGKGCKPAEIKIEVTR